MASVKKKPPLKVYTTSFKDLYSIGACGLVVARSRRQAACLFAVKLFEMGLEQTIQPEQMIRVPIKEGHINILNDGEY